MNAPKVKSVKKYLLLFLISAGIASHGQDLNVDSLKLVVLTMAEDTNKVNTLNTIADQVYRTSPDESVEYGSKAKLLADQLGFHKGLAMAYKNIGLGEFMQGNYAEAIKNWEPALDFYREFGDLQMEANILSNLASSYYQTSKFVETLEYALPALKMAEEMGDSLRIGTLLMTIGLVYSEQASTLDSAVNYYMRVIDLAETISYTNLQGIATINLGEVYLEKEDLDRALYYFEKSLTIVTSPIDIAASLTFIGRIYSERGDDQMAIVYYNDALEMAMEENAQGQTVGILLGLAAAHENQKLHGRAIEYYQQAESIAEEIGLNQELSSTYEGLATNYAELNDFPNAYKYLSLQNTIDNTIYKLESEDQTRDLINNYQMEKKQDEIAILEQEKEIEQLLSKRQRGLLIGTAVFGLLILAMAGGLYNRMKFIRATNEKINTQNELITDSISYAQRIQSAILPSPGMLQEVMPEHFVILKPKDIVSGDFYWVKEVQDHLVIVGADCTGHGVPGAFMSMLGITLLNDLIDDRCYDAPSAILEKLRAKVKEMLVQEGEMDEQKDGMDLALAIFNKTTRELHFAGANNPLYVIRNKEVPAGKDLEPYASTENGNYQLYELKGDKQPIGVHWEETPFTNRSIKLSEHDTFYIFSDGFVDQFGGEHRKKYKSLNFKKLLLSMQDKPMVSQQQLIEDAYDSWRGEYEQIDDVSVIGVRI